MGAACTYWNFLHIQAQRETGDDADVIAAYADLPLTGRARFRIVSAAEAVASAWRAFLGLLEDPARSRSEDNNIALYHLQEVASTREIMTLDFEIRVSVLSAPSPSTRRLT